MPPWVAPPGWAGGEAEEQAERICAGAGSGAQGGAHRRGSPDPAQVGECVCPLGSLRGQPREGRGHGRGWGGGQRRSRDMSRSKNSWTGLCGAECSPGPVGRAAGSRETLLSQPGQGLPAGSVLASGSPRKSRWGERLDRFFFPPAKYR